MAQDRNGLGPLLFEVKVQRRTHHGKEAACFAQGSPSEEGPQGRSQEGSQEVDGEGVVQEQ